MGKKDFDIEFDFEEEYGFDPKSFLGTEEYDDTIDLNAFSDEELGLTSRNPVEDEEDTAAEEENEDFDLDEDLDLDDFLNLGNAKEETEEEDPEEEEDWVDEAESDEVGEAEFEDEVLEEDSDEEDAFDEELYEEESEDEYAEETDEEDPDLAEDAEPEEIDMDETMEYEEELQESPVYEEGEAEEETFQFEEEDPETKQPRRKPRQKKERKPVQLPNITLPKLKTPNIFTKFYDLYFAPVLDKNWQNPEDAKQDPHKNPRRRRKTKAQIFKEVYLPAIITCVCLVLVMSFLIGSLSNVIAERRIEKENEQSRLDASISAQEQAEQAGMAIAEEAEQLAAGYDYEEAIKKLDSLGDLTQFPELNSKRAEYVNEMAALVEYKDTSTIPNLSFHVLINDLERALKDAELGGKYNRNFVSTTEFSRILQQLYDNGYVLVDFNSFVGSSTDVNGKQKFEPISMWLPADKKPVMITETMVNYFEYMVDPDEDGVADAKGAGFASKLVVDGNGDIKAEYVTTDGQTLTGNYDLVPILEDFIKEHPDFSYRGARAILAFTGDEGVFGYRCNTSYIASKSQSYYDEQVAGAKKVADALRAKGYTLASYTYNNKNYANFNANNIKADMDKWAQEVTTVIGAVDTFVFAQQGNLTDYNSPSLTTMQQAGFNYYIANATGTSSATTTINESYVRQNRLMVTGNSMAWNPSWFTGLFNCSAVMEATVRGNVPN